MLITKTPKTTISNLVITQLRPEDLHGNWEFLRRGALDIFDKVRPHTEWVVEDLYAALRYPQASNCVCFLVARNSKTLGWCCGNLERTRYGKTEFFLWCAWTIPLGEREERDDVEGARDQLIDYLRVWAKSNGATRISTLSARRLEFLGWVKAHTVYYLPL